MKDEFSDKLPKTDRKQLRSKLLRNRERVEFLSNTTIINKGEFLRTETKSKTLNNRFLSEDKKNYGKKVKNEFRNEESSHMIKRYLRYSKSNHFQNENGKLIDDLITQEPLESYKNPISRKLLESIRPITTQRKNKKIILNLIENHDDFKSFQEPSSFREKKRKLNFSEEDFSELTLTNIDNFKRNLFFVDFHDKKILNIQNEIRFKRIEERRRKSDYNMFMTEKGNENEINGMNFV